MKSTKKLLEQSKSKNQDDKSVKEGSKSSFLVGSVENSKENGVRVSTNGKEDLIVDLEREDVPLVKGTNSVESEMEVKVGGDKENRQELITFCDAENEEVGCCVGTIDGISLLVDVSSEMGREDGYDFNERKDGASLNKKREKPDGKVRDMSDSEDREEDKSNDGDYEFCVGDFVWGKIKSYPWWPGQIYDSSDASDYALKVKYRDKLLVAYFDGTFAWCYPYQLKPFEKDFEDMSKQSSSKGFVNAVQKAVDEIGRLVELKMTCSCAPKESLVGLARPIAVNSGIKPGVLVPEGGIAKLWNYLFGPLECLAELKNIARVISINNMLEFTELKCWLSTFYRASSGRRLPFYHEPQPILGLEDNSRNQISGLCHDAEGPSQGPVEEETNQSLLLKCLMDSENGQYQRRKQKSIAEIMEGYLDTPAKSVEEDVKKEGTGSGNSVLSSLRKKSKVNDDANDGTSLSSRPKRRKVTKLLESTPAATGTEIPIVERDDNKAKEKTRKVRSPREEEEKNKATHTENDDQSKEENNASTMSVEMKTVQRDDGETKEQIEKSLLSRERKRSKYLSPPYTNINRRQNKKDLETEFLKISSEARVAERMTRAAANIIGSESPTNLMRSDAVIQKKDAKDVGARHEKSNISNPETMKLEQSTVIDTMHVKVSAKDVLSGVRYTALNLKSLERDSLDVVEGFIVKFRSSVYCNGSNYKIFNKSQPGRKRKSQESEPVSSVKDQNQTEQRSVEQRSRRAKLKKSEEAKTKKDDKRKSDERIVKLAGDAKTLAGGTDGQENSDKSKLKHVTRSQDKKRKDTATDGEAAPDINIIDKQTDGKASPASLFVRFSPTSSLPSKNDLIKIYSEFGYLNEEETEMLSNDYCGRVVFLRRYDAEEALKSSQFTSPFGDSNCNFELRNSSSSSQMQKLKEMSNAKTSPAKEGGNALKKEFGPKTTVGDAATLDHIKKKLKLIGSVLANSDGKISPELKTKLEVEVKDLLEKVNTVVGSSSS